MDKIILNVIKKLKKNGYEAYVVGGYVRDKLLGIESNDVDICTNALPKEIIDILKLDKTTIDNCGCVNIKTKKYNIDITTFREENNYQNRRPKTINYVDDLTKDLKRRDFTINSIVLDCNENIIDIYNGKSDIENKIIRCIGNVKKKLTEDPLRILRAIRFAIIYDFKIDEEIIKFIVNNKELLKDLSYYRKRQELDKILSSSNRIKGLNYIKKLNLLDVLEIGFNDIKDCNDLLGMYAQITLSNKYPFNKYENMILKNIKEVLKINNINNKILYKYGLYICLVVGEIIGVDNITVNKMYKGLPIKSRKDIKINVKSIVKLNNNCYNNINEIYLDLENKILEGTLINNSKNIIKYLRK